MLGGVVVDFGDKTIDLSVASRVNKLNSLLSRELLSCLWCFVQCLTRWPQNPFKCMLSRPRDVGAAAGENHMFRSVCASQCIDWTTYHPAFYLCVRPLSAGALGVYDGLILDNMYSTHNKESKYRQQKR